MENDPIARVGAEAKAASHAMASLTSEEKNRLLHALADALDRDAAEILQANANDLKAAEAAGLDAGLLDRLTLNERRLQDIARDVRAVAALPDPVGEVLDGRNLDSGLFLLRKRVPLGVVAAIYEARPNVTIDVASLCLKTGNSVILRGGKETAYSNEALVRCIQGVLEEFGLPRGAVQAITDPDRALVTKLLHLDAYVDMVIPRGGAPLHKLCREQSRIPVITGGIGVCHIVVDVTANQEAALPLIENAKVQRPTVCNSVETVLVLEDIAAEFLPKLAVYLEGRGVSLHAGPAAIPYLRDVSHTVTPVADGDYDKEWLTLDINVEVVETLDTAIAHIREHGTGHTDAILTESMAAAERFVAAVDSSTLFINASTRFTDGGQFGLGAEVAISTQKLHARGPMGLDTLTTYKWIGQGNYTVRA